MMLMVPVLNEVAEEMSQLGQYRLRSQSQAERVLAFTR